MEVPFSLDNFTPLSERPVLAWCVIWELRIGPAPLYSTGVRVRHVFTGA